MYAVLRLASVFALTLIVAGASAQDEKKKEERGGAIIGTLVTKGKDFVEVKAPGEEKGRRYVPHWVGGAPAQGGGFDKKILKQIEALKVGERVRLEWNFEERPRIVRIEALKQDK